MSLEEARGGVSSRIVPRMRLERTMPGYFDIARHFVHRRSERLLKVRFKCVKVADGVLVDPYRW